MFNTFVLLRRPIIATFMPSSGFSILDFLEDEGTICDENHTCSKSYLVEGACAGESADSVTFGKIRFLFLNANPFLMENTQNCIVQTRKKIAHKKTASFSSPGIIHLDRVGSRVV